ncbi:ParB/RepB/Spo0J family partition protein [Sphingobacterium yanglingense]|uniref:ParB/RepB/Spo0J family partition protein n=1 Tax=Sphingobacterium yanglingense TaxID=1437280 RepID=A0A4R6WAD4_9SPHI|nr:ParB/RepB/Spo0J family partition protein [Sphingobacterium yanglingense]TDQ73835.1 ParB/RepB/Spo0J family partition protein [Sphingobacterium yanglingense]
MNTTIKQTQKEYMNIVLSDIAIGNLNYRKSMDKEALADFAKEIALHGVISPILVRPGKDGKYELVTGERRYRAAVLANLKTIPAVIRPLTDDEVKEIQLVENIQRENPHPMDEALVIKYLLDKGQTIEEAANRIGKSKAYVYNRLRLAQLILSMQEMFRANKISFKEAITLGGLEQSSQMEFFDAYCKDWKNKGFIIYSFDYKISQYQYKLCNAPFNTKDEYLISDVDACTSCPFNSATLGSLFPEEATDSVCSKKECFRKKCQTHLSNRIQKLMKSKHPNPVAILTSYNYSIEMDEVINNFADLAVLKKYGSEKINRVEKPVHPKQRDFIDNEILDEEAYTTALVEYHAEMDEFESDLQAGKILLAYFIDDWSIKHQYFNFSNCDKIGVTAKQVQDAIKQGEATPELLEREKQRLTIKENRAKEIDKEKVKLNIYTLFSEVFGESKNCKSVIADQTAVRLIVYNSLDYAVRNFVNSVLFPNPDQQDDLNKSLSKLNDDEFCFLTRMALVSNSQSKLPNNSFSDSLYQIAKEAKLDLGRIEKSQKEIADNRAERFNDRMAQIDKLLSEMVEG